MEMTQASRQEVLFVELSIDHRDKIIWAKKSSGFYLMDFDDVAIWIVEENLLPTRDCCFTPV